MTDPAKIRILVVDDSEDFQAAVTSWIEAQPDMVLAGTAGNGEQALQMLPTIDPDLVLMDAFMPVVDGFEATRRIKTDDGAPSVVMLSVHEGSEIENEAWAAGADAFVPKAELATRLPQVIRDLVSDDGRKPPRAGRDSGVAARESRRPAEPNAPTERSSVERNGFWKGVRARVREFGKKRRPEVVSAKSLTEGGIS